MDRKIKVAIIGFGRMGEFYFQEMIKSGKWEIVYICDVSVQRRLYAKNISPKTIVTDNELEIFQDHSVEVVGLFALANSRKKQIELAVQFGKHIISEKPISDTIENEWKSVNIVENSSILSTVNLYLRNSWYHQFMKKYVNDGEIGELAIIRICHLTPGLVPGEGHEYEGPSFHDCGMHYVDIARWYANSEFKTGHAQALRMWNYKEPWFLQGHGTFDNNVVYDITQGHVYGQLSKDQTHNSYVDIIGTKGIIRMTHDFKTAIVELHGITQTLREEKPFGNKNIDVLCNLFAESLISGVRSERLPSFRDSAIASQYAWKFLDDAGENDLPAIGNNSTLEQIKERRRKMTNGYGLIRTNSF